MKVDVLLGLQWGDEGKGKIVDVLAKNYDIVARFQGGPNAGHSLELDNIKFVTHQIPSGIFHENIVNVIGNGVVFDPVKFRNEVDCLSEYLPFDEIIKKIILSDEAHLILPSHRWLDEVYEVSKGCSKIGSTKCGIGPAYTDKIARIGIRIGEIKEPDFKLKFEHLLASHKDLISIYDDLYLQRNENLESEIKDFFEAIIFLKQFNICDTVDYINKALKGDKRILAEGAQGTSLDINFGDYPFVTSSTTVSAGVCIGLGVAPQLIGEVFGLVKAYATRVGSGPFPTEQDNEIGEKLRINGNEFGATTGRSRRCDQIKRAIILNGVTQIILSKADVLNGFDKINVSMSYNEENMPIYKEFFGWRFVSKNDPFDFSLNFFEYKDFIEKELDIPITYISNGPNREDIINIREFV